MPTEKKIKLLIADDEKNVSELDPTMLAMFDEIHGDTMRELGYYPALKRVITKSN